jgi:hypothetical protein
MILHREWDEGGLETLAGFIVELPDLASKCVEFLVHLRAHLRIPFLEALSDYVSEFDLVSVKRSGDEFVEEVFVRDLNTSRVNPAAFEPFEFEKDESTIRDENIAWNESEPKVIVVVNRLVQVNDLEIHVILLGDDFLDFETS